MKANNIVGGLALALGLVVLLSCGDDGDDDVLEVGAACRPDGDGGTCASGSACGEDLEGRNRCLLTEGGECDPSAGLCSAELTCAEVVGEDPRCFGRVYLRGDVTDTSDAAAIEGAQIFGLDEEGAAVTDVQPSGENGEYTLEIPVPRNDDGSPADATFTLQASALGYQPFPSGLRVALPIDAADAEQEGDGWVIDNALTDIGLIALDDAANLRSVSGQLSLDDDLDTEAGTGGVLIVATSDDAVVTAVTDKSGHFTLFNVPDGDYEVRAYPVDLQADSDDVSVSGDDVSDVELVANAVSTTTVSGSIQVVNASGGLQTSIILVVEDTFDPLAARGAAPRGLRAPRTGEPNIDGEFNIEGVPAGTYVVLAAYENDDLVRDPDQNIAGTDFVTIDVSADDDTVNLDESFKVTEALTTISPGAEAPEAVDEAPDLVWADDSSEDYYEVRVYDAFGQEVWSKLDVDGVSGSDDVSVNYDGPLEPGMYYQFRVLSWRQPGNQDASPISATEDLRGVFYMAPESEDAE